MLKRLRHYFGYFTAPNRTRLFLYHYVYFACSIIFLNNSAYALKCYNCSQYNAVDATKQIFDRITASGRDCLEVAYCQGKWCFQRLDGTNVTFGCADYAYPVGDTIIGSDGILETVDTQCRAFFSGSDEHVYHATCFCKTADLCNTGTRVFNEFRGFKNAINFVCFLIGFWHLYFRLS